MKIYKKSLPDDMTQWRDKVLELLQHYELKSFDGGINPKAMQNHTTARSLLKRINSPYILTDKQKWLIDNMVLEMLKDIDNNTD